MRPLMLPPVELIRIEGEDEMTSLHRGIVTISEKMFGDEGEHPPCWYILTSDGIVQGVLTQWTNDYEQMASKEYVCMLVHALNATAYSFVVEAYMVRIEDASTEEEAMTKRNQMPKRLGDLPEDQRDEVLMVSTVAADHNHTLTKWLINSKGKSEGRKPFLGPRIDDEYKGHQTGGRMFDLFASKPSEKFVKMANKVAKEMLNERPSKITRH